MDSTHILPIVALGTSIASLVYTMVIHKRAKQSFEEMLEKDKFVCDADLYKMNIGDTVVVLRTENKELEDWLDYRDTSLLTVKDIDESKNMFWAYGCSIPINMADVMIHKEQ